MSTPYWGKLPSPKIVKNRRMSDDDPQSPSLLGLGQGEGDPAAAAYNQHHQNHNQDQTRASVQTTLTAAPTETTFSPSLDSPTASALAPHGLAPRPPSYQRPRPYDPAAVSHPPDHHRSQFGAEDVAGGEEFSPSPPLASDPRRAPPASDERHLHSSNGRADNMEAPLPSQQQYDARQPGPYGDSGAPLTVPERRRRKSTMPKSPLQRLELTLDSMTKEEKRARIEAAERRARERLAREAGRADASKPPSEEPSRRPPPQSQIQKAAADYSDSRTTHIAAPPAAQPMPSDTYQHPPPRSQPAATRAPVPQQQQPPPPQQQQYQQYDDEHGHGYGTSLPFSAREIILPAPQPAPQREPEVPHELPKRNLSFRERAAARDDIKLPIADEAAHVSAQEPPAPKKGFGSFLTRSGSNKLKKAPPGDPWYHVRRDSEQQAPPPAAHRTNIPAGHAHQQQQQPPQRSQQPDVFAFQVQDEPEYQEPAYTPAHVRRPSVAAEPAGVVNKRAFVPNPPPEEIQPIQRRATEPVRHRQQNEHNTYFTSIPQARQANADPREGEPPTPAVAAEQRKLERHAEGVHFSSDTILYNRRDQMEPGDGLYQPPTWLEEWKRATPGKLSGPLLDLSEEPPPSSSDRNKAWWEETGRRRSSSYTPRTRRSDAYEGEHEFSGGKDLSMTMWKKDN